MRSVRFDDELEERLEQAAEVSGQSASEIIRDATSKRCDEILGETLYDRIKDVIGVISSKGRRGRITARNTGHAFAAFVASKRRKRR